ATTDMRIPIQAALSHPERLPSRVPAVDLALCGPLEFEPVDTSRFRCVELAYRAGRTGGSLPAVMNAANEEAVAAFLAGEIGFDDIPRIIEAVMEAHDTFEVPEVDAVIEADRIGRRGAFEVMDKPGEPVGGPR
ncbi:MAG: 1-deoxy-D-xylulose-5-phosphate reductoisomerase, partial [Actinomycetota bacterium]|nr:1-deoxy-D-xylulose-5-phosphate reductoisomerase [Actinomycetota bacterium]